LKVDPIMDCSGRPRLFGIGKLLIGLSKACDGTTAVETAIVLPAFLLLLLCLVESGILFWTQSSLQFAVEAAARCAAVNTTSCGTTSSIQSYAAAQAVGITVSSSSFSVSQPSCGQQVSISYPFSFVDPNLFPWSITLKAQSCHP
jgi:Flp pilus assembly protein TadG